MNATPGEGKVVFVGAGPGAPDLITVRGARVIAEADIHWCVVDRAGHPTRPPEQYDLRKLMP